jgi:hypothetical protein
VGGAFLAPPAATLARRILEPMAPGAIVLLHDRLFTWLDESYRDRTPTLEAVETVLQSRPDYRFVTVSQLLQHGKAVKEYWIREPDREFLGGLASAAPAP